MKSKDKVLSLNDPEMAEETDVNRQTDVNLRDQIKHAKRV